MNEAMNTATGIIRSEHRTLAAVIHGFKAVVEQVRDGRTDANFRLLWAMLYYIEAYPEKLHHPKEDDYLFAAVRARTSEAATLLAELEREHRECEARLNGLRIALGHYEAGVAGGLATLAAAADHYATFYWEHMTQEEDKLLPLAQAHLTDADWSTIAEKFAANNDPLLGHESADDFWKLLRRIVSMAPAPIGLGSA